MSNYAFLNDQLSKKTSVFGLRLWVVLGVCVGAAIVLVLFLVSLWFASRRNNSSKLKNSESQSLTIPNVSKEIQEIRVDRSRSTTHPAPKIQLKENTDPSPETEAVAVVAPPEAENQAGGQKVHIEIGKDHRISYPERVGSSQVNLVEWWLKTMVTTRNAERILDPKLPEKPSSRAHLNEPF